MTDRIEVFEQMLAADPDNTMVMFGLAKEYEKIGRHHDVIRILEQYLTKADDEGNAYGTLAQAYGKTGNREKAIESYKKGIDVSMAHGHPSMANEYRMTLDLDFADDVCEFVDQLAELVVSSGLSKQRDIRGCSDGEIHDLEKHFDIRLPEVYKAFLKRMGKGAGLFMQGTDIFYEWLFGNREAMEVVLALDKNPFSISQQVFVFSSHHGYIFHFFDTSAAQGDPPVYGYGEGESKPRLVSESLSDFLRTAIVEQINGWAKVRNKPLL